MRILLLLIITAFISCKPDSSSSTARTQESTENTSPENKAIQEFVNSKPTITSAESLSSKDGAIKTNFNKNGIPDACDLLTQETISRYVGIPSASIMLADGSSAKNNLQRACFFKR